MFQKREFYQLKYSAELDEEVSTDIVALKKFYKWFNLDINQHISDTSESFGHNYDCSSTFKRLDQVFIDYCDR